MLNISKAEKRFQIVGWLLFLVCAVFFIMQSLTDNNIFGFTGSLIFLAACFVFLIPLILSRGK
ncbi:cytochrome oxidase subunit III [Chloroflexota bacterium]